VHGPLDCLVSLISPLTHQDKLAVITRSLLLKLQHFNPTVSWHLCSSLLRGHTADLQHHALQVLGQPHSGSDGLHPDAVRLTLHPPLRAAGLPSCLPFRPLPRFILYGYMPCMAWAYMHEIVSIGPTRHSTVVHGIHSIFAF
jgi:hypothetical protein